MLLISLCDAGLRGNLPLGYVRNGTATYTSTNGCRIGQCDSTGYNGTCFEVTDLLKGDIARSYFYLSVAYMNEWRYASSPPPPHLSVFPLISFCSVIFDKIVSK